MPVLPIDDFGERIQALRPGTPQAVPVGAVSASSAPFGDGVTVVRFVATTACFVVVGPPGVTATTAGHYLPMQAPEYFRVQPGEVVAAIRASGDGALHVSEMQ